MTYSKSPLNYIGGKYKMLPAITKFFPQNINIMYDLFAGGCDVCTNVIAKQIYANDINHFVIEIYKTFQQMDTDSLLNAIDSTIERWHLSMYDGDGFLKLRQHYNETPIENRNPIELYALVCYSFNYQFRFNNSHGFNNPFGRNRSSFNSTMRRNLVIFHEKIKNILFSNKNFQTLDLSFLSAGDFVYADPPYRITTASYNDGKRGFEGWKLDDDLILFDLLDELNSNGAQFAMSNVVEHKGFENKELRRWMEKYSVHEISYNYNNSNYQTRNKNFLTREILITNY
jgi:DNA adenine methylase Dam